MTIEKNTQLTHKQHQTSGRKFPLSIIASDINHPENIGSLFRLCDALGIEKLYLCGDSATPPNSKINKTSRSTEKHVHYEAHQNTKSLIEKLKTNAVIILSLEITTTSIAINSSEFSAIMNAHKDKSFALILGSEKNGINDDLLAMSDATLHIPMQGNNSSMNVITAASIACFEITKNLL
jgi:tRNA G18 (ribose-2'-O)-methylase SpoU